MATGYQKDWNDFVKFWTKFWNGLQSNLNETWKTFTGKGTYYDNQSLGDKIVFGDDKSGLGFGNSLIGAIDGTNSANAQYEANLALQQQAQQFNSAEAEKQRNWEEMMSNTAYQRGMEDMKKAGLNPWLMVQGSGASTASGSSASSSASSVSQRPTGAQTLSNLVGSALSIALIAKIIKMIK